MKDLDKHTYKVIIKKLKEAGYDNPELNKLFNGSNPVDWVEMELSHRIKGSK